jgi:antirestriction protein ArdC
MPTASEIRQTVTNAIIDILRDGKLPPWRRPWRVDGDYSPHANFLSKRPYTGVNALLLPLASIRHGFSSRWWGTFNQWKERGGSVKPRPKNIRPGHWGTTIVFCRPITKQKTDDTGEETTESFQMLKTFTVFNADQVEGVVIQKPSAESVAESDTVSRFERADEIIEAAGFDIRYGGNKAFYSPSLDRIHVPDRGRFTLPEFYETVFHEMVHATEHPTRLNWDRKLPGNTYALGELIAELGGCFIATEAGLPTHQTLPNHAAYLKDWLTALENDERFIFRAASQAQKAADYILSFSRKEKEVAVEEPVMV